eukprot:jgi/Bigna1/82957/fgenesh1_pg.99_\
MSRTFVDGLWGHGPDIFDAQNERLKTLDSLVAFFKPLLSGFTVCCTNAIDVSNRIFKSITYEFPFSAVTLGERETRRSSMQELLISWDGSDRKATSQLRAYALEWRIDDIRQIPNPTLCSQEKSALDRYYSRTLKKLSKLHLIENETPGSPLQSFLHGFRDLMETVSTNYEIMAAKEADQMLNPLNK